MTPPPIRNYKQGPERKIQDSILNFMRNLGWFILETHGNMYMSGFPDLYCTHYKYGIRWVEVKYPEKYSFTPAQMETFPLLSAHGTGIWILTAATQSEYAKLWHPPNWHIYVTLLNPRSSHHIKSPEPRRSIQVVDIKTLNGGK